MILARAGSKLSRVVDRPRWRPGPSLGRTMRARVEAQEFYQRGIERLLDGIARFRVCVLCAEEDPSRCHHRLLITRTLVRRGVEVRHVRGSGAVEAETSIEATSASRQLDHLAPKG